MQVNVKDEDIQRFFRILEEQKASIDATNNLLRKLEGYLANPTAAQWVPVDTSPKTINPEFTVQYVLLDNTSGTGTAYIYRGQGNTGFPDVKAATGTRVISRIAKARTLTVVGDVGIGVLISAMPLEQYTA